MRRSAASLVLSKSEIGLSKREMSAVLRAQISSMIGLPRLRYARGQPNFDAGTSVVPILLGRTLMSWKTPKIVEVPVGMEINMYACAARK